MEFWHRIKVNTLNVNTSIERVAELFSTSCLRMLCEKKKLRLSKMLLSDIFDNIKIFLRGILSVLLYLMYVPFDFDDHQHMTYMKKECVLSSV